jgi:hypothetical protein
MVPEVAQALARLGQRERFTGDQDPVFASQVGRHLDASALRRRYSQAARHAGLRPLPFHSLRHYFGSMAVNRATLVQVQSWMGHAHIQTTARYLHAKSQADDAALLAGGVRARPPRPGGRRGGVGGEVGADPTLFAWTDHALLRADQLHITRTDAESALAEGHTQRRSNPGTGDWMAAGRGVVVIYGWPTEKGEHRRLTVRELAVQS